MQDCNLHTILRLPRGTFTPYSQGVKANVIFFQKGYPTENVWIFDARSNVPGITKKDRPLTRNHFAEFEKAYGKNPNGQSRRTDGGDTARFRKFSRQAIKERGNKLNVGSLLEELDEPFRTIVYLAAVSGMRRGELFGLKWKDVDFQLGQLKVVRSIIDQKVGETKTRGSKRSLPLPTEAVVALGKRKDATQYGGNEDWVFASPHAFGELPYWPNAVMVRHVQPAADRAGISKRIGWHTFRHTFATLLQASGAGVKVTQELLRHSSPVMTLGTYAQAVTGDKRDAQDTVAALFSKPHLVTSAA